jgi:hypothetical protein
MYHKQYFCARKWVYRGCITSLVALLALGGVRAAAQEQSLEDMFGLPSETATPAPKPAPAQTAVKRVYDVPPAAPKPQPAPVAAVAPKPAAPLPMLPSAAPSTMATAEDDKELLNNLLGTPEVAAPVMPMPVKPAPAAKPAAAPVMAMPTPLPLTPKAAAVPPVIPPAAASSNNKDIDALLKATDETLSQTEPLAQPMATEAPMPLVQAPKEDVPPELQAILDGAPMPQPPAPRAIPRNKPAQGQPRQKLTPC